MRTKASTAALRQTCKRLLLHQRRASCHPASGRQMPAMAKAPIDSGPFRSRMNATEYFYCGATGYFGRGGMGL
jgi:hypothetical protein